MAMEMEMEMMNGPSDSIDALTVVAVVAAAAAEQSDVKFTNQPFISSNRHTVKVG